MNKSLEFLLGSALIIGSFSSSQAQESQEKFIKILAVQKDNPDLVKSTEYYMAFTDSKYNIDFKDDKVNVFSLKYVGNGRGSTEVQASANDNGKLVNVTLTGWPCGNGYLRGLDIKNGGIESYYQFCTSAEGGEELAEGLDTHGWIALGPDGIESNLKIVPKDNKDKYSFFHKELDKWSRILDIDNYKKMTGWRNARKFFDALPETFNDKDSYKVYINNPEPKIKGEDSLVVDESCTGFIFHEIKLRDGEVWPNYMDATAKGDDSLNDITFRYDERSKDFKVVMNWNIDRGVLYGKTSFKAKLFDNNADGSLDKITLGYDELEVFELKDGKVVSTGVTHPDYSQEDLDAIFSKGKKLYDSASLVFGSEKLTILRANKK